MAFIMEAAVGITSEHGLSIHTILESSKLVLYKPLLPL